MDTKINMDTKHMLHIFREVSSKQLVKCQAEKGRQPAMNESIVSNQSEMTSLHSRICAPRTRMPGHRLPALFPLFPGSNMCARAAPSMRVIRCQVIRDLRSEPSSWWHGHSPVTPVTRRPSLLPHLSGCSRARPHAGRPAADGPARSCRRRARPRG